MTGANLSAAKTGSGRIVSPELLWRLVPFASIAVALGLWEALVVLREVSPWILPRPSAVLVALSDNAGPLAVQTWATVKAILVGFLAGSLLAIPMGLAIGIFPALERSLYYAIVLLNTLPKVALAPLLVVWFGYGLTSKVILIAIGAFVPVLVDCIAGFKFIDRRQLYITRSMGASAWQTFWKLRLPHALPYVLAGLKTSLVLAIVIAIVIEYVASTSGLGYAATRAVMNDNIALVFAIVAIGAALGFVATFGMDLIERLLIPWKQPAA